MSGCGRKHRAKHLTQQYLDDDSWHGPVGKQSLAVSLESPHGKHMHAYIVPPPGSPDADFDSLAPSVVYLPGKFSKVIWIAVADVIVVADEAVERKPSPPQLQQFFADNPAWQECVKRVLGKIESTSASRICGPMPLIPETVPSNVEPSHSHNDVVEYDPLAEMENPNRSSLKHRKVYFDEQDMQEEGEEEEQEEDDEEEETE